MAQCFVNVVRRDHFVPFGADGFTRLPGLAAINFAASVSDPADEDVGIMLIDDDDRPDAQVNREDLLLLEVGVGTGNYRIRWRVGLDAEGEVLPGTWKLNISYAARKQRWQVEHNVVIDDRADVVLDEVLTNHNVPDSLAAYVKQAAQAVAEATEPVVFQTKYKTGSPVPRALFIIRNAEGVLLHTGHLSLVGGATIQLPQAVGYTVDFSVADMEFGQTTFAVPEGGTTVTVVAKVPSGVTVRGE